MATPIVQIPFRKKGQATCVEHRGKQLDLYCKKCETPVCHKCLSTSHEGHKICELCDVTPEKKQDIQNFIQKTEQNDLVQLQKQIVSTDLLMKDNTSNFENLSYKLKMQTEKLKRDLDFLTEQTISLYHKMEEDNTKIIQKYKHDLEIYNQELRQQVKQCKAALQGGSHIEIYDTVYNSQISLPVKPVLASASFTSNKTPQHHLELALGEIALLDQDQAATDQDGSVGTCGGQKPSSTSQQSVPKGKEAVTMFKVLEEWRAPVEMYGICPTTDGQVWTRKYYNEKITLLDRKGKVKKQVKHKTKITDISLSPTTHTLWVCDDKRNIMELVSGRLTHRFSTEGYSWRICVTASNHVIVGMTNKISKFTTQGQMVRTSSTTGTGKPLVCTPKIISECPVTHNVAVVDLNRKTDGADGIPHVVVIDTAFKKLFVYRGDIPSTYEQSSDKGDKPFDPWGVVYDSVGNIIIGDHYNKRVLLISGSGEFLRILHTDTYPTYAVGVDRDNVLWVRFGLNVKLLQYSSV